jgi:hypothetical protein
VARTRLDHQIATDGPNPFLDDGRAPVKIVQFRQRQPSRELESTTVIVDYQLPQTILGPEPDVN